MTPTAAFDPAVDVGATITINDHRYPVVRVESRNGGVWADVAGPGGLELPVPLESTTPPYSAHPLPVL